MPKTTVTADIPDGLNNRIENRAEEESENKSDSIRYFLQKGIEAHQQPATDGGRPQHRFSFIELLTMTLMLASAMTAVLSFGAGIVPLRWVLAIFGATGLLLTVYFGQLVFDKSGAQEEAISR